MNAMPGARTLATLVLLLQAYAGAAQSQSNAEIADLLAPMGGAEQPGCVAGAYRDGRLVQTAAGGSADLQRKIPLTARTVFNIGSVSKQFTAFAVLLLEQRKALSSDDEIIRYVPELGEAARGVRLAHLLHHVGGLRDYIALLQLEGHSFDERTTREQALAALVRQRAANSAPATRYEYSNTGYFLLGLVVERVSGVSLAEFLRREVFRPLAMANTRVVDSYATALAGLARGYSPADGAGFEIDESPWEQTGDGQVHTTIEDLARWEDNFLTARIGGRALLDRMLTRGSLVDGQRIDYAAGLSLWRERGLPTVSHGGDWAGYQAHFLRFPEQRYAVGVLCNRSDAAPRDIATRVAERHLASAMKGASEPRGLALLRARGGGVEPSRLPQGLYRNADTASYVYLSVNSGGMAHLKQANEGSSVLKVAEGLYHLQAFGRTYAVFSLDNPPGARIVLQDSPQPHIYEWAAAWTPRDLEVYAGRYGSTEARVSYEITVRQGQLVLRTGSDILGLRPMAHSEFEGIGLPDSDQGFTLRFEAGANGGFRLFVDGVRGVEFSRER